MPRSGRRPASPRGPGGDAGRLRQTVCRPPRKTPPHFPSSMDLKARHRAPRTDPPHRSARPVAPALQCRSQSVRRLECVQCGPLPMPQGGLPRSGARRPAKGLSLTPRTMGPTATSRLWSPGAGQAALRSLLRAFDGSTRNRPSTHTRESQRRRDPRGMKSATGRWISRDAFTPATSARSATMW